MDQEALVFSITETFEGFGYSVVRNVSAYRPPDGVVLDIDSCGLLAGRVVIYDNGEVVVLGEKRGCAYVDLVAPTGLDDLVVAMRRQFVSSLADRC